MNQPDGKWYTDLQSPKISHEKVIRENIVIVFFDATELIYEEFVSNWPTYKKQF